MIIGIDIPTLVSCCGHIAHRQKGHNGAANRGERLTTNNPKPQNEGGLTAKEKKTPARNKKKKLIGQRKALASLFLWGICFFLGRCLLFSLAEFAQK